MSTINDQYSGPVIMTSAQSELMPNYMASSAVSTQHPIRSVLDSNGNPAVFSIGTNNQLWAIFRDPTSTTGWVQYDLTSDLAAGDVLAVGVSQVPTGEFALAIAVASDGSSPVYITGWISNDTSKTDWTTFASTWVLRAPEIPTSPADLSAGTVPVDDATVQRIVMGAPASTAAPLIVVVTSDGTTDDRYCVNGDASDTSWSWAVYSIPGDATDVLDMAFGYFNAGTAANPNPKIGTYLLYQAGSGQPPQLVFTSPTQPVTTDTEQTTHYMTAPDGATCLSALLDPAAPHFTNLYLGVTNPDSGDTGIQYISNTTQSRKQQLATATEIISFDVLSDIQEMILAQDSANVSIWVLDHSNQTLWYTTGPQGSEASSEWSSPLLLQEHVGHISAQRNPQLSANQIVTALSNNTLSYQWQDPTTTLWQTTDIPLQDAGGIQEFDSYTTQLHFEDDKQTPLVAVPVSLTCSQWVYVTINGYSYELGPDAPVSVTTDSGGNIAIITKTATLGAPIYTAGVSAGPMIVNPADNVIGKLQKIQTAADLQAVTLPDGTSLLPADANQDAVNFAATTLNNLTDYIANLPPDGSTATSVSGATFTAWGGSFNDAGQFTAVQQSSLLSEFGDVVEGAALAVAGDVLRAIGRAGVKIGKFLFQSGDDGLLHFAIQVGEETLRIIIKAFGPALDIINWVLTKVLGIDLKKIFEWLGFIFEWSDIVTTHSVFANIAKQLMNLVQTDVSTLQTSVDNAFTALLSKVDSIGDHPLSENVANQTISSVASTQPSTPAGQQSVDFSTSSAPGNFSSYQIMHGGILSGQAPDYGSVTQDMDDLMNTIKQGISGIKDEITEAFDTLKTDFDAGTLTIGEVVGVVTKLIAEGLITTVQTIVDALFDLVNALLAVINDMLFGEIDIPFLTKFYALITKTDENPDGSPFTLVDGFCLLLAIPATVSYKIVSGTAPFADGNTFGLDTATSFSDIKQILMPS